MSSGSSTAAVITGSGVSEHFKSDDYLIGVLRRIVAEKGNAVVKLPQGGEIWLLASRGEYFVAPGAKLTKTSFCAPAKDYVVTRMVDAHLAAIEKTGKVGRNIDELLWSAALYVANGRLIEGCLSNDVVELKHWPNLTRVPATPNTLRIAALLTRYPTWITMAARMLKVPMSEMNDFYSAARCAGLAVAVNRKAESVEQEIKPHRDRSLLSQILSKIADL